MAQDFRKRYKINLSSNYTEKNNPILNDGDSIWIRKNKFSQATDTLRYCGKSYPEFG